MKSDEVKLLCSNIEQMKDCNGLIEKITRLSCFACFVNLFHYNFVPDKGSSAYLNKKKTCAITITDE